MLQEIEQQRALLRTESLELLRKNQHPSGAFIASPTFSQYDYCWLRDGTWIAYSLLVHGYREEVRDHIRWVCESMGRYEEKVDLLPQRLASGEPLQNTWFFSARYTLEGLEDESDWPNFQIDGYGSWLWLVAQYLKSGDEPLPQTWDHGAQLVIRYLEMVWNIPNSDCWEEFNEHIHPATLACLIGGLKEIAHFLHSHWSERALLLERTVTDYVLAHRHESGYFPKYIGSETIDASLIWLAVPYGALPPDHPSMVKTIEKIEQEITREGGVKRYPQDTYYGGGQWIILSAFLGWYYLKAGKVQNAEELMTWIIRQKEDDGSLPEQVLDDTNDPSMIEPWEERWGAVATPLLWSHAMFLILDKELSGYNQQEGERDE